jgi:YidC/Oxa1 family membrane protein insertase
MEQNSKRIIIAFALSFGILMLWKMAFPPPPEPPAKSPAAAQSAASTTKPAALPAPSGAAAAPAPGSKVAPATPVAIPVQQGTKAEEIVVENGVSRVTFSTEGAVVKSWILKEFKDEKQQPLDIVNTLACKSLGYPMSLRLADGDLMKKVNAAFFVPTPTGPAISAPGKIEFVFSDGTIQVRKVFTFANGHEVRVEVSVSDGQRNLPVEVAWPGGLGDHSLPTDRAAFADKSIHQGAAGDKIHSVTLTPSFFGNLFSREPNPADKKLEVSGPLTLAGLEDRYFAGIFLPESPDQGYRVERQPWTPPDWKGEDSKRPSPITAWYGSAAPKALAFRMFVGPKDLDLLRQNQPPLDGLVDYGWFSFVARPLFLGLHYIHDRWTGNFGWAIILLTIFINIALFPIKLKQIRSGQAMQRIAPEMKSIQAKYEGYKLNDPRRQKMQQEMMKLYSDHGVNPLSGCLPLLIQMPFLYGFYRVLDLSIELRHAPWIGWIHDLSARDPYYILPVLMTVTMFLLQKMTPMTVADPAQQRMMMIMPLFMGFMFINFASGLVLYWLTGNVVGIAQQVIINKFLQKPVPPPGPPARKPGTKET